MVLQGQDIYNSQDDTSFSPCEKKGSSLLRRFISTEKDF